MERLLIGIAAFLILREIFKPPSIGKLNKYRFIPVYDRLPTSHSNGKTNIAWAKGRKGVYIIKEDNKIVYVGSSSSDLYRTAIRHFQTWNDSMSSERVSYKSKLNRHRYTVRIIEADNRRLRILEAALIEKHNPRDNFKQEPVEDWEIDEADRVLLEMASISDDDIPF